MSRTTGRAGLTIAVIGCRKGSRRLPGKNRAEIAGRPLFAHTVAAALASGVFDTVILTSDDEAILEPARAIPGLDVEERPPHLAGDQPSLWDVARDLLDRRGCGDGDVVCVLDPCYPFRTSQHLQAAFVRFEETDADALVSVTPYPFPPQLALSMTGEWLHREWAGLVRKAEHPPRYHPAGGISIVRVGVLRRLGNAYSDRTVGFVVTGSAIIDIDEEDDLRRARAVAAEGTITLDPLPGDRR